jgi:flavin reductase (DIM6/NTAB) family NADH-FMN oxidoreductase RutF
VTLWTFGSICRLGNNLHRFFRKETPVDENAKKTALRTIPYGLYVLTAETQDGRVSAATVNWVTQTSFAPPLVAVGVKADSSAHSIIKETRVFALSVLGKGQQAVAFAFFKPAEREGDKIGGEVFHLGRTGAPILSSAIASIECELVTTVEEGDHSLFVGRVVDAAVSEKIEGRPDDATLVLKDLGEKTFYGG